MVTTTYYVDPRISLIRRITADSRQAATSTRLRIRLIVDQMRPCGCPETQMDSRMDSPFLLCQDQLIILPYPDNDDMTVRGKRRVSKPPREDCLRKL
ncbi:hypothetical protein RB195_014279 [Necator americanus]|uniref:NTR domain-containing protein n=1 Tax=Necator americanus TaxID=51031 RepID=A0ABR1DZF1_NECAM